jgi:hypothetical protein
MIITIAWNDFGISRILDIRYPIPVQLAQYYVYLEIVKSDQSSG